MSEILCYNTKNIFSSVNFLLYRDVYISFKGMVVTFYVGVASGAIAILLLRAL